MQEEQQSIQSSDERNGNRFEEPRIMEEGDVAFGRCTDSLFECDV